MKNFGLFSDFGNMGDVLDRVLLLLRKHKLGEKQFLNCCSRYLVVKQDFVVPDRTPIVHLGMMRPLTMNYNLMERPMQLNCAWNPDSEYSCRL